jgi:4'-phosphopantetheinyl transferase EntD
MTDVVGPIGPEPIDGSRPECTLVLRGATFDPTRYVLAEELSLLGAKAVPRRRREFALGRACARLALAHAGYTAPRPILRGNRGEPLWPAGWVGSITHASEVAAAVVAEEARVLSLGLDIEDLRRELSPGFVYMIGLPEERAWVAERPDPEEVHLRTMQLFSAKEAVFKALYPLGHVPLGFLDARLVWQPWLGGFEVELLREASPDFPVGARAHVTSRHIAPFTLSVLVVTR